LRCGDPQDGNHQERQRDRLGKKSGVVAVSFWYEQEREFSIETLSLSIPMGRTTAIVGASGSGKTTLVSLLCRFYEPRSGEIRVNGQNILDFDIDQWRREIAWVSQDAYLFSGSVAENIRYGRLDATDEEIRLAAEQADASGFISRLPEGYETQVGNGGVSLSRGQVQRIALARALVRKARILILDEATNAIDSVSEDWIQHSLRTMAGDVTVIVISHRLSSVKHADHVVVLENGAVAQQGAPREVIAAGSHGYYSKLRTLQHVD
jgi:subfamily B ATP-binding cassette protein MsbA